MTVAHEKKLLKYSELAAECHDAILLSIVIGCGFRGRITLQSVCYMMILFVQYLFHTRQQRD